MFFCEAEIFGCGPGDDEVRRGSKRLARGKFGECSSTNEEEYLYTHSFSW
jgi:hypothetical protein